MRQLINAEHARFVLPKITKIDVTRARMIISLRSHSFISGCDFHDQFQNILTKVRKKKIN